MSFEYPLATPSPSSHPLAASADPPDEPGISYAPANQPHSAISEDKIMTGNSPDVSLQGRYVPQSVGGESELRQCALSAEPSVDSFASDPVAMERYVRTEVSPSPSRLPAPPGPNSFASSLNRDALLAYAYQLYERPENSHAGVTAVPLDDPLLDPTQPSEVYKRRLLPLLITLRSLHPADLSVLLLMSCTYHALGDYDASLRVSQEILNINPNFVEAMNNVGTVMQASGRLDQAYEWWWKAIRTRPTYWDAIDNLLGFLYARMQGSQSTEYISALCTRVLEVCSFVQHAVFGDGVRPRIVLHHREFPRLQRLFLTSASVHLQVGSSGEAIRHYFKGVEIMTQPPLEELSPQQPYSMREFILALFVAGYLVQASTDKAVPQDIAECLRPPGTAPTTSPGYDLLQAVRSSSERILGALQRLGKNALPFILLLPEHAARLPAVLFPASSGVFPAICTWQGGSSTLQPPDELTRQHASLMTGNIFLALAKYYQDLPSSSVDLPGFEQKLNINHSLAIMFYYLALALAPAPSTYNNMGIILSTSSDTFTWTNDSGEHVTLSGIDLARIYYSIGLQMDPEHPHLLTNLGSLYKDQGSLGKAIEHYAKALSYKPDFDIALANMGNAVKDTGRSWEALQYYQRAVKLSPNLPEAVCGLVSSMASICDWRSRDSTPEEHGVDDAGNLIFAGTISHTLSQPSLMQRMVTTCEKQITAAYMQNVHAISATRALVDWLDAVQAAYGRPLTQREASRWQALFQQFYESGRRRERNVNEGGFVLRFISWLQPRLQRRWYLKAYGKVLTANQDLTTDPREHADSFLRPTLPRTMSPPGVPSILPFNTFIYPLPARTIRVISHRNALRISFTALSQPWLPRHVYAPPGPPFNGVIHIGYVSNDVNNHPLSHLMQSVFGMHDRRRFKVFTYTTSPWDGSSYRPKISEDVEVFVDASSWSSRQIIEHIVQHKIHILINLGGYTKGTRNDVFAARPCPVQMQLMGYAGTLGAGWCDYLVCDPMACPPDMCATEQWRMKRAKTTRSSVEETTPFDDTPLDLGADPDPEDEAEDWIYCEKYVYMPHTFMVTDHKQSFRTDEDLTVEERSRVPTSILWRNEEQRRAEMRQVCFPNLPQSTIIFANFNQLYKIDPGIYAVWLHILRRVPNSLLWLLRFPAAGEEQLIGTAKLWAGEEVASRIRFTDVAQKDVHVHRGRVADLFLDTVECNAHTITADVIWPGTPILTFPKHRHKMCSRVAASMVSATGFGDQMIVSSLEEYEERAVTLANSVRYTPVEDADGVAVLRGEGELIDLRRNLFLNRDRMPLFDTERWTRNIEKGYLEAWRRWVEGTQFEESDEWEASEGPEKQSGSIWVTDDDPVDIIRYA